MHLLKSSPCMSPPSEIKMGYLPIFIPSSNTSSIERKIKVNSDISILQKRSMRIRTQGSSTSLSMFMSNRVKLWRVKLWPSQCILHIHQLVYFSTESCCILYLLYSYYTLTLFGISSEWVCMDIPRGCICYLIRLESWIDHCIQILLSFRDPKDSC